MFTQQHYKKITELLRGYERRVGATYHLPVICVRSSIILDFADLFESDNSKFDRKKFLDAIYGKEEKNG